MKIISLKCPNCGASMQFAEEQKMNYCQYCGSPLMYDDGSININISERYIDEAKVQEIELEKQRLDYQINAGKSVEDKEKEWKATLTAWLTGLGLSYVFHYLTMDVPFLKDISIAIFGAVLVFGGLGVAILKPKEKIIQRPSEWAAVRKPEKGTYTRYSGIARNISSRNKSTALVLCIFLGVLGAHQFYVGKTGLGIIYLFTGGLFGIGGLIDIVSILAGSFRDCEGKVLY